ncbi:MAG TPA: HD domain-containing phosphohydrolase [Acidobacteriota bacterium]|nr:HD domain-containing phosphohydrolase [Acidobacteriota bacterium]
MTKTKARVLIVDDEIYIQEILKATLEDAGFETVAVGSVEAALAELSKERFDIAFTDIRMPGRQGTDLLQEIRSSYSRVVVIMITALDSADTAVETIRMGAYDYIVKPFNLDQVLVAADRALDKRRLEDTRLEYQKYLEQAAEERAAETRRLFYSMTQVLIRLLEIKLPFNVGHAARVAEMSRYVARELRMTEDGVRKVYLAALLHDIGLMAVEDVVLRKHGALSPEEHRQIKERSLVAEDVLRPILDDEEVLKYIRHYRERVDGTGYPDGLKGSVIPLGARIISVVEAFDAMTQGRPYRSPLRPESAIAELGRCADTQFDPQVVSVFTELYEQVFRNFDKTMMGRP